MKVICGKFHEGRWKNGYWWELDDKDDPEIGDYAIVENQNGFALVEVVAVARTTKNKSKHMTNNGSEISKKAVYIIPRHYLDCKTNKPNKDLPY